MKLIDSNLEQSIYQNHVDRLALYESRLVERVVTIIQEHRDPFLGPEEWSYPDDHEWVISLRNDFAHWHYSSDRETHLSFLSFIELDDGTLLSCFLSSPPLTALTDKILGERYLLEWLVKIITKQCKVVLFHENIRDWISGRDNHELDQWVLENESRIYKKTQ